MTSTMNPLLGRTRTTARSNGRTVNITNGKARAKQNGSILNFFGKAQTFPTAKDSIEEVEESLFLEQESPVRGSDGLIQTSIPPRDCSPVENSPDHHSNLSTEIFSSRYNEKDSPSKRRRLEDPSDYSTLTIKRVAVSRVHQGPFIEDFDDDDNDEETLNMLSYSESGDARSSANRHAQVHEFDLCLARRRVATDVVDTSLVPSLRQDSTIIVENEFEGIDEFIDDEFPEEGEEYLERKWMEEQREFEIDSDEPGEVDNTQVSKKKYDRGEEEVLPDEGGAPTCPICSASFIGVTDQEASIHVNDCLDGKPPSKSNPKASPNSGSAQSLTRSNYAVPPHKRFQRTSIAKPGQENPFGIDSNHNTGSSAFSMLMSSHAEDSAWATAAAAETASRGKPAYQRTCPFYKILPGFSICVDAFRYGAVEGCKAYFLSHFHSDHYIGLTSSWCHGPIYCSHVTANLVRRQLRVDPKWVLELSFDQKAEVPETGGVEVTMIPANHCPGSSLFLFEKVIGRGKSPKVQRVLHCGDFRACPAQVQHPLLRPEIVDAVTGKNVGQQKLDVCYLDTTYLTPKYAFPSQEEVIKACADMCVSLSKDQIDGNDGWEKTKKQRAESAMAKFVQKEAAQTKEDTKNDPAKKSRGRLLVIVGTYSIGKERICLGVARALDSKIYAPPNKQKICAALEDPELNARLTSNPLEAQVHMQMMMEIRAETLADYLTGYKPHFSRIVGFRPSGWNYRPPTSRGSTESPTVHSVLHSESWKSRYSMRELVPQRGSTREAQCFGVPYSEHSSFRELTMFCCALRIDRIIPTVNVGSAKSREKMKAWCEKWATEKKKNGLYRVEDGRTEW